MQRQHGASERTCKHIYLVTIARAKFTAAAARKRAEVSRWRETLESAVVAARLEKMGA